MGPSQHRDHFGGASGSGPSTTALTCTSGTYQSGIYGTFGPSVRQAPMTALSCPAPGGLHTKFPCTTAALFARPLHFATQDSIDTPPLARLSGDGKSTRHAVVPRDLFQAKMFPRGPFERVESNGRLREPGCSVQRSGSSAHRRGFEPPHPPPATRQGGLNGLGACPPLDPTAPPLASLHRLPDAPCSLQPKREGRLWAIFVFLHQSGTILATMWIGQSDSAGGPSYWRVCRY